MQNICGTFAEQLRNICGTFTGHFAEHLRTIYETFASQKKQPALILKTSGATLSISDQQEVIEAYKNDPLVHERVSFGIGMEMYNAAEFLNQYKLNDLPKKTLLVHSKNDWLTSAKATEAFYGRNSKNAILRLWDDKMHELHNSTEQKEILAYYHDWMQI